MGLERHIKHEEVNSSKENFKLWEFLEWLRGYVAVAAPCRYKFVKKTGAWNNERSKRLVIAPLRSGDCYISLVNIQEICKRRTFNERNQTLIWVDPETIFRRSIRLKLACVADALNRLFTHKDECVARLQRRLCEDL